MAIPKINLFNYHTFKKLKLSHYTPRKRSVGREGIAPTHSRPRHYTGVSGQRRTPAAL
jgi:hypothetical protein